MTNVHYEIFGTERGEKEKLIGPMNNSTCSLQFSFENLPKINEMYLIRELYCTGNIVKIDCNFGHIHLRGYESPVKPKDSKRGRKKTEKPKKKKKKVQGDGTSFGSQVTFTIVKFLERKIPTKLDRWSSTSTINANDPTMETVLKEYKIKLFRNGVCGVPGVIKEDYSDAMEPMIELRNYLRTVFKIPNINIINIEPKMKNYKMSLLDDRKIDLRYVRYHCDRLFGSLYNLNFNDVFNFLSMPPMEGGGSISWNKYMEMGTFKISWDRFFGYLERSTSAKEVNVNKDELMSHLMKKNFEKMYTDVLAYFRELRSYYIIVDDDIITGVIKHKIGRYVNELKAHFEGKSENSLANTKYDGENYPGYLIRITPPVADPKGKKITVKAFPSGKINIDGGKKYEYACNIYEWLNDMFYDNETFHYPKDFIYQDSDSDFGYEDEWDVPE